MAGPGDFFSDPVSYIYGGNTGLSYSDLKRRRDIAVALASRARKFPTNLGEGLTYFGEALGDTIQDRRLAAMEGQYKAGEDERERGITPSNYIPGSVAAPPVTGASPAPAAPAGAPAGTAANPITAPPTIPPSMFDPRSVETQPPAMDSVPAVQPVRGAVPPPRAAREPPPHIKAIIDARVPEEMRPYYYRMAEKESSYRPDTTSSTGAAGLFQFTRGAGKQYGIAGDTRYDPVANTDAAVRFTEDNTRTLRNALGREPSWSELALAHQQGAGTAAKMLTGTGNAPDYNLAVNRAGGLGPQAAANKIMAYYNMPGGGGAPSASVNDVAGALARPPQGPPTPGELASQELLQETVGVGGGGPSFPPTASAGRAGVVSDAPSPGASPLGAITDPSIGDTLQRQRGGGVGGIMPPAQPTVLPHVAQVRAKSVPVTARDAAMGGIPGSVAPPSGFGAAPAGRPAAALPSDDEMIPPDLSDRPYPRRYKEAPKEATVHGPDEAMLRDQRIATGDYSPGEKARAEERLKQATYFMQLKNARAQEAAKNYREGYEAEDKAEAEWKHKAPERRLETRLKQLETQKAIADRKNDPVTALQLQATLDVTRENLAKLRREAAAPETVMAGGTQYGRPAGASEETPFQVRPGLPAAKEEPLTEGQAEAVRFVRRVKPDLDAVERAQHGKILTKPAEAWRDVPLIGNLVASDEYKSTRNALGNWGAGFMKLVSGATITPTEAHTQLPAFIPQVGDSDDELLAKSRRRRDFTDAVERTSGREGIKAIREQVDTLNDEHLFAREAKKEPVKVSRPEDAKLLNPGQRILLPDGREGQVPARKRSGP